MSRFSIIAVFKESIAVPFQNMKGFLGSIGVFIGIYFIIGVSMTLLISDNLSFTTLMSGDPMAIAESMGGGSPLGLLFFVVFMWFILIPVIAMIFNYWVRHAAFGPGHGFAPSAGEMIKMGFVNALKFFGVGIVLAIAFMLLGLVFGFLFGMLGLLDLDSMAGLNQENLSAGLIGMQVMMGVGVCFIYAIMSGSLTRTALGSDYIAIRDPHANDFAVVLMLIYVPVIIVSAFLPFIFGLVAGFLLSMVVSLWSTFAIASAHGIRHKYCLALESQD